MQLQYSGLVQFSDMRSVYPLMIEPVAAISHYLIGLAPSAYRDMTEMDMDAACECAHAKPIFVPHNQNITAPISIVDNGTLNLTGAPSCYWNVDSISPTGTVGGNPQMLGQAFQDK